MINRYDMGDVVTMTGTFTDPRDSDAPIDPEVVKLSIRDPSGTVTTYVYGTDPEVIRSAKGIYYADIDTDTPGRWYYRWWSTGTGKAAEEQWIQVAKAKAT